MSKRVQSPLMREVVKRSQKCELCGSVRGLEAHHIIPVCCGGEDCEDNLICICQRCHSMLTPRSLLVKIGIAKVQWHDEHLKQKKKLYELIEQHCERDGYCTDSVFDAIEEW